MRSIIISTCAAITSIIAVNIATATAQRQKSKVLISPAATNVPTDDPDVPLNYLLLDDLPQANDDDDLQHLTDVYGVIGENVDGQFLEVCVTDGCFDPKLIAATVAEDILARYRAGVNRKFRIIASGLFAQIALDVQRVITKEHNVDPATLYVNPKLILIHPLLGWEQHRTPAEHRLDLYHLKRATIGEVLLGNLAFRETISHESIAFKRAMLTLKTNSIGSCGRKLLSSNSAVIYDDANKHFCDARFKAFVEFDGEGLHFIDIRRRKGSELLSSMELISKALREVCQPSNPDVTS